MNANTQAAPFPMELHILLHGSEAPSFADIVSFLPHGRAFQVHDEERFCNQILPVWFGQYEWGWFHEELRAHGFHSLPQEDPGQGAVFFHELFLKGRPELAGRIVRNERAAATLDMVERVVTAVTLLDMAETAAATLDMPEPLPQNLPPWDGNRETNPRHNHDRWTSSAACGDGSRRNEPVEPMAPRPGAPTSVATMSLSQLLSHGFFLGNNM